MSYIERKKIKGRYYLYRYETFRDPVGRVRRRMLQYLGPESDFLEDAPDSKSGRTKGSYIECKEIKGRRYLYRYKTFRDADGHVRRRMLNYLGPESDFLRHETYSTQGRWRHGG